MTGELTDQTTNQLFKTLWKMESMRLFHAGVGDLASPMQKADIKLC